MFVKSPTRHLTVTGRRSSPIRQAQVHRRPGAEDHRHRAMRGGVAGRGRARLAAGPTAKPVGGGAPAKWRGLSETPPLQRLGRNPGALLSGVMARPPPPLEIAEKCAVGRACHPSGDPPQRGSPPARCSRAAGVANGRGTPLPSRGPATTPNEGRFMQPTTLWGGVGEPRRCRPSLRR